MNSSKFNGLDFNENNQNIGDDNSMFEQTKQNNVTNQKSSSHSFRRLGTPLTVSSTTKSEGSTFKLLGTRLDSSSPKSGAEASNLSSPTKQVSPKVENIQMTLDEYNSPKKQSQFVDAGVEVPGLEHRASVDSQDYHSVFSSTRLSSFAPETGSFFDLAQYKARLEEQLSLNKSDSMRKADSNDSLEYRLFRETKEYDNLMNYSNSMSPELNVSEELEVVMESTQFDRFSHFGYSFNKLLNSLTWLASLHLSCRNANLYLNADKNQPVTYPQTNSTCDGMDTYDGVDSYQSASVNHYPVNYVIDHDMTPEVQTTMHGYPVYSNSINATSAQNSKNNVYNYTMNNTQYAPNNQMNSDNLINIDSDFNMDNNYNYSQPSFSGRNYSTTKVKADNSDNSQYYNTHGYNQGKGYYTNQQTTSIEQHTHTYQQPSSYNNYHTSGPNEHNQPGTNKQKNYRGKYFFNNRMVNGVEQEVYDLDVDLGITYTRKV